MLMLTGKLLIRPRVSAIIMKVVVVSTMDQAVLEVVMIGVANAVATILISTPGMDLFFYVTSACVYAIVGPKKSLRVSTGQRMPRVKMQFGPREKGGPTCPSIGMMIDYCASLNIMHFKFTN